MSPPYSRVCLKFLLPCGLRACSLSPCLFSASVSSSPWQMLASGMGSLGSESRAHRWEELRPGLPAWWLAGRRCWAPCIRSVAFSLLAPLGPFLLPNALPLPQVATSSAGRLLLSLSQRGGGWSLCELLFTLRVFSLEGRCKKGAPSLEGSCSHRVSSHWKGGVSSCSHCVSRRE